MEYYSDNNIYGVKVICLGFPDKYIEQGTPQELYKLYGLDGVVFALKQYLLLQLLLCHITNDDVAEQSDFASIDVSFISLTKVLPAVFAVLKQKAKLVCLIKPQFEAGREKVLLL